MVEIRIAMTTADALPEDMPGLRAAARALIAERDELLRRIERMQLIIRQLQRAQFGRHSERLDPDQLQLALEEEREIVQAHVQAAAEKTETRPRVAGAVVQAAAPERLIRAGLPTEAMVAHVLVSKYAWHLPLYRKRYAAITRGRA